MASMWAKLGAAAVVGGILVGGGVGTAEASTASTSAAKGPCAAYETHFTKLIELVPGGVHTATRTHPGGWVTGQNAHFHQGGPDDGYFWAAGKKHTHYLAPHATICLLGSGPSGLVWHTASVKTLQKAVNTHQWTPWFNLTVNRKGQVTKVYQLFHP